MNLVKVVRTGYQPQEIVARLYSKTGSRAYWEGKGATDAEAIGALVCKCPHKFSVQFDVRAEFDNEQV